MRLRDLLLLGLTFGAITYGIARFIPDAIRSTADAICTIPHSEPAGSPK